MRGRSGAAVASALLLLAACKAKQAPPAPPDAALELRHVDLKVLGKT